METLLNTLLNSLYRTVLSNEAEKAAAREKYFDINSHHTQQRGKGNLYLGTFILIISCSD
jgi:hypothetical protein